MFATKLHQGPWILVATPSFICWVVGTISEGPKRHYPFLDEE